MSFPIGTEDLEDRIRRIPKAESHLHIGGALPYESLHELDPKRFPENPPSREPGYRFLNFVEFETLLVDHALAWFTGPERYYEACKRIFAGLFEQNIRYLETSLHMAIIEFTCSDGHELTSEIKSAAPDGMDVKVVGGLTRDGYTSVMAPIIDSLYSWDDLDGIDMHGQEWLDLEPWASPVWKRCKDARKIIKVHAVEFGGPEKTWEALDILGAECSQNLVRACEDPELVSRLVS